MLGPEYRLNGRTYKTVTGLSKALFADSGCDSHSMVDSTRHITCTRGRGAERVTVARYHVSPPVAGEVMTVTRVSP